ncbi:MAG: shikimate dehydrogenase [Aeromonas sp.]
MDRYRLFGHPVQHSKSPFIHTLFARQTQQDLHYGLIEPPRDGFTAAAKLFFAQGGKGANVTLPFKQEALLLVNQLTPRARLAGAVNTLHRTDDNWLIGDNTDGAGLLADLAHHHLALTGQRILLLGAGGAVRGILAPLLSQAPSQLVIANRTQSKAEQLVSEFAAHGALEACSLSALNAPFDLIINATSQVHGGEPLALSPALLHAHTALYDLSYAAGPTPFLAWGQAHGARVSLDGLGMLVEQAAEAFMLWRGLRPGTAQVLRELKRNLGQI